MSKSVGRTLHIRLTDFDYNEVKIAAKSYQMSPIDYATACIEKMTQHRLQQLKKESPNPEKITGIILPDN